jgi:hypothetical protein
MQIPAARAPETQAQEISEARQDDADCQRKESEAADQSPSIRVFRSLEDLKAIEGSWKAWQHHLDHDYDDYISLIANSGGSIRPFVLCQYELGAPESLLVGRVLQRVPDWPFGYKRILRRPVTCLEFNYGGFLRDPANADADAGHSNALVTHLLQCLKQGEADYAWFPYLRVDSSLHQSIRSVPSLLARDPITERVPHRALELPGDYERFYSERSKNTKSNIRKYSNRVSKKFGDNARIRCFTRPEEMPAAHQDVKTVFTTTWQYRLGTTALEDDSVAGMWAELATKGRMLVYVLYFEDKPVAFVSGFLYNRTFDFKHTGFDTSYDYFHPGSYLLLEIIKEFCADDRVSVFDFGYSDEEYKRRYGDMQWDEESAAVFAPNTRGLRLFAARVALSGGTKLAKWTLSKLGDYRKLRKRLRNAKMFANRQ